MLFIEVEHSQCKKFHTDFYGHTGYLSWAWWNCLAWEESLSKIFFFHLYPRLCMSKEYHLQEFGKMLFFFPLLSAGLPDILPGILVRCLWKPNWSWAACKILRLWGEELAADLSLVVLHSKATCLSMD